MLFNVILDYASVVNGACKKYDTRARARVFVALILVYRTVTPRPGSARVFFWAHFFWGGGKILLARNNQQQTTGQTITTNWRVAAGDATTRLDRHIIYTWSLDESGSRACTFAASLSSSFSPQVRRHPPSARAHTHTRTVERRISGISVERTQHEKGTVKISVSPSSRPSFPFARLDFPSLTSLAISNAVISRESERGETSAYIRDAMERIENTR